jgi:hypothetical protein
VCRHPSVAEPTLSAEELLSCLQSPHRCAVHSLIPIPALTLQARGKELDTAAASIRPPAYQRARMHSNTSDTSPFLGRQMRSEMRCSSAAFGVVQTSKVLRHRELVLAPPVGLDRRGTVDRVQLSLSGQVCNMLLHGVIWETPCIQNYAPESLHRFDQLRIVVDGDSLGKWCWGHRQHINSPLQQKTSTYYAIKRIYAAISQGGMGSIAKNDLCSPFAMQISWLHFAPLTKSLGAIVSLIMQLHDRP